MNRDFLNISILKTICFNIRYFGIKGLLKPRVLLSRNVRLIHMGGCVQTDFSAGNGRVYLGFKAAGIADAKTERFCWDNYGTVIFQNGVFLGSGVRISNCGEIFWGQKAFVSANSNIACVKSIKIGSFCKIAWGGTLIDSDFHKIIDTETGRVVNEPKEIIISEKVWIGCNTTILKGVVISPECIVGAGSTVNKSLTESNCVYKDNTIIKRNVSWED